MTGSGGGLGAARMCRSCDFWLEVGGGAGKPLGELSIGLQLVGLRGWRRARGVLERGMKSEHHKSMYSNNARDRSFLILIEFDHLVSARAASYAICNVVAEDLMISAVRIRGATLVSMPL